MKKKNVNFWKRATNVFHGVFFCKKNIKRDIIIIVVAIFFIIIIIIGINYSLGISFEKRFSKKITDSYISGKGMALEEDIYHSVQEIQRNIDIGEWKNYQSRWYGFEVKYPDSGWEIPRSFSGIASSKWEYRFQFRKNAENIDEQNPYVGFDVVVYNLTKARELSDTEEFPQLKNVDLKEDDECETINGHIIETGDYPAEEIYIPPADNCYNSTLFFSFTKGDYSYNLVPAVRDGFSLLGDPMIEIADKFPEFFSVVSTLDSIDIVRPKPKPPVPKITARHPVSYKNINGKLVCAKKNDKPSKSAKDKKKHLDLECCLDPDEYPNPWCYYDPEKYGKYLK
ncbi:MAG: hypothetical protein UR69_C0003G0059 [Candidatus Moranbacteria bacterium GW2011_GWE2_35_2-]|nr:MAG: hypothetical protein UR69_C0003G0059 [Candidatus Moranbacteria bacterium GW2011_GWE2_35_2-]KKQ05983.1 MAG: hypothetical protein US15_C0024G0004 [Candidatus Moranbacteria bacterium GW2011_GWF1_36_4]KKQ22077.1 MAG: hypothetical protein US37_C0004G0036 [Candidatus Moranbacteria bacterium GW2011_GWF2_37_11]KKQ29170.1 MAG: hypothetical protein US44_C0003G0082 [Candidatus Moranbacteria bacterium GW2011_GWD1_37_17]KKQ31155.1 MAG: hypothetical protein US47_C0001G0388 [Candidatus Moranbacteria b